MRVQHIVYPIEDAAVSRCEISEFPWNSEISKFWKNFVETSVIPKIFFGALFPSRGAPSERNFLLGLCFSCVGVSQQCAALKKLDSAWFWKEIKEIYDIENERKFYFLWPDHVWLVLSPPFPLNLLSSKNVKRIATVLRWYSSINLPLNIFSTLTLRQGLWYFIMSTLSMIIS